MAIVYVPGMAQIRWNWMVGQQPAVNVMHCAQSYPGVAWTQALMQNLVDEFLSAARGSLGSLFPVDTSLVSVDGVDLTQTPLPAAATSTGQPVNGSVVGSGLPQSVAILVNLKTGARYKGGHGRIYLPPGPPGQLDTVPNHWQPGYPPTVKGILDAIWSTMGQAIGAAQYIVRYTYTKTVDPITGKVTRTRTGLKSADLVLSRTVPVQVASQRNRLSS